MVTAVVVSGIVVAGVAIGGSAMKLFLRSRESGRTVKRDRLFGGQMLMPGNSTFGQRGARAPRPQTAPPREKPGSSPDLFDFDVDALAKFRDLKLLPSPDPN